MKMNKQQGKVWLVGAGPGDAGLLTRKGYEILQQAEVVVYDALVSLEILSEIPRTARKIYVGKRAGRHALAQEEISRLLVELAKEGNLVVRLKGGDPFVFGRGGEEAAVLAAEGVPYEVVPGISSAIAAPAYAGIPITHRDVASSFHVITGQTRKGGEERIDYKILAHLEGTLVFLMGVQQLSYICQRLQEEGMDPDTPAAIIENGTIYQQRQLLATLASLPEKAQEEHFKAPSVILIGKTAAFMEQLAWQGALALRGKQCIVTRPKGQAERLSKRLRAEGAHVISLPSIDLHPIEKKQEEFNLLLEEMGHNFFAENWIVLSSPSDVEIFFQMLAKSEQDVRSIGSRVLWAVIGSRTEETLRLRGIRADLVPEQYEAEALASELRKKMNASSKVYVFKSERGSCAVYEEMTACGIPCEQLAIYQTIFEEGAGFADELWEAACAPESYVMFTSASCVDGFCQTLGETRDFSAVQAVCIGEKTAASAKKRNMQVHVAERATLEAMIELLKTL